MSTQGSSGWSVAGGHRHPAARPQALDHWCPIHPCWPLSLPKFCSGKSTSFPLRGRRLPTLSSEEPPPHPSLSSSCPLPPRLPALPLWAKPLLREDLLRGLCRGRPAFQVSARLQAAPPLSEGALRSERVQCPSQVGVLLALAGPHRKWRRGGPPPSRCLKGQRPGAAGGPLAAWRPGCSPCCCCCCSWPDPPPCGPRPRLATPGC